MREVMHVAIVTTNLQIASQEEFKRMKRSDALRIVWWFGSCAVECFACFPQNPLKGNYLHKYSHRPETTSILFWCMSGRHSPHNVLSESSSFQQN